MNSTLLWWLTLTALWQAMLVSARLPSGCAADGTVLVSCTDVGSDGLLDLSQQGLTAIRVDAFDNMAGTARKLYAA